MNGSGSEDLLSEASELIQGKFAIFFYFCCNYFCCNFWIASLNFLISGLNTILQKQNVQIQQKQNIINNQRDKIHKVSDVKSNAPQKDTKLLSFAQFWNHQSVAISYIFETHMTLNRLIEQAHWQIMGMTHVVLGSRILVGYLVIKIELWFFRFWFSK